MAFLKYFLSYALCAVAVVLYQSNFVYADDSTCISCSDDWNPTLAYCNNGAVDITNKTMTICTTKDNSCGTFTYKDGKIVKTVRGCDITCDTVKKDHSKNSGWNCETCTGEKCNAKAINSTATTFGINLVPVVLSSIVAFYCY